MTSRTDYEFAADILRSALVHQDLRHPIGSLHRAFEDLSGAPGHVNFAAGTQPRGLLLAKRCLREALSRHPTAQDLSTASAAETTVSWLYETAITIAECEAKR
jgi:hypothetical protein